MKLKSSGITVVCCKGGLVFLLLGSLSVSVFGQNIQIGRFSEGILEGWEEQSFSGITRYQLVQDSQQQVLSAQSSDSASGLFYETDIDLTQTPYLNWSWKVENTFSGNDETRRSGDDYPARIFVVVSGGIFFWQTRAINYVWSSDQPAETQWESAVTENAMMLSLRSGDSLSGQWLVEKRNIREDFRRMFGVEVNEIHAVAIMSDSDDTGQSARAYYGDIFFSEE